MQLRSVAFGHLKALQVWPLIYQKGLLFLISFQNQFLENKAYQKELVVPLNQVCQSIR